MLKIFSFFILLLTPLVASAVDISVEGRITSYNTGWNGDHVRVRIEGATYTESNCPKQDGYITSESDNSGFKTHTSALLSAFMSGTPVKIAVEGCILGRPKIFGVYMKK